MKICKFVSFKPMGRILAIDYGQKRVGLAVTDQTQIIANGLTTIGVGEVFDFLNDYLKKEKVDTIVVGLPRNMNNEISDAGRFTEPFVKKLRKTFPDVKIDRMDERFTSSMARDVIRTAGLKKSKRQDKSLVDTISATLILQSYMSQNKL